MTPFQCVMKYKEEVEKKLGKQILAQTEKYATHTCKYENVGQAGGKVARQIRTIFGSTRQLGTDSLDLRLTRGLIEM